jgi:hypothetical protein
MISFHYPPSDVPVSGVITIIVLLVFAVVRKRANASLREHPL